MKEGCLSTQLLLRMLDRFGIRFEPGSSWWGDSARWGTVTVRERNEHRPEGYRVSALAFDIRVATWPVPREFLQGAHRLAVLLNCRLVVRRRGQRGSVRVLLIPTQGISDIDTLSQSDDGSDRWEEWAAITAAEFNAAADADDGGEFDE